MNIFKYKILSLLLLTLTVIFGVSSIYLAYRVNELHDAVNTEQREKDSDLQTMQFQFMDCMNNLRWFKKQGYASPPKGTETFGTDTWNRPY